MAASWLKPLLLSFQTFLRNIDYVIFPKFRNWIFFQKKILLCQLSTSFRHLFAPLLSISAIFARTLNRVPRELPPQKKILGAHTVHYLHIKKNQKIPRRDISSTYGNVDRKKRKNPFKCLSRNLCSMRVHSYVWLDLAWPLWRNGIQRQRAFSSFFAAAFKCEFFDIATFLKVSKNCVSDIWILLFRLQSQKVQKCHKKVDFPFLKKSWNVPLPFFSGILLYLRMAYSHVPPPHPPTPKFGPNSRNSTLPL